MSRTKRSPFQRTARKLWPRAWWIWGDGPFALVTYCGVTTVTLWQTREAAERQQACRGSCGSHCSVTAVEMGRHQIIDLTEH